jgi:hypothetical protein
MKNLRLGCARMPCMTSDRALDSGSCNPPYNLCFYLHQGRACRHFPFFGLWFTIFYLWLSIMRISCICNLAETCFWEFLMYMSWCISTVQVILLVDAVESNLNNKEKTRSSAIESMVPLHSLLAFSHALRPTLPLDCCAAGVMAKVMFRVRRF